MKETITVETVVLGLRLASAAEYLDPRGCLSKEAIERMSRDHTEISAAFQGCSEFLYFCSEAHALLAHTAAAQNCELGRLALFALLSKTFWAGWKAAQQEMIDEQLKAMEPKCPEP